MIDRSTFQRLLDLHGANLARWPDNVRLAAQRLRKNTPEGRRDWRKAERLDRWLDHFTPEFDRSVEAAVRTSILRSAARARQRSFSLPMLVMAALPEAAVFASVAAVGLMIGLFLLGSPNASASGPDVVQLLTSID